MRPGGNILFGAPMGPMSRNTITGVALDATDTPVPGADLRVFRQRDDLKMAALVADAQGVYVYEAGGRGGLSYVHPQTERFYVRANLPVGATSIFGTTAETLQATES